MSSAGRPSRVGLVLGGGAMGSAYHAGALVALEHDAVAPRFHRAPTDPRTCSRGWPRPPVDPLLVRTVRARDCHRTVFGPAGRSAPLSLALAASCAVPGYFRPVRIEDTVYVDGGAISATNADVLGRHGDDLDLVVVVSPLTGESRWGSRASAMRRFYRRALDHKIELLHRRGIPTIVIEPGQSVTQHMSLDFMSDDASARIISQAFIDTGAQINANHLFDPLRRRSAA